MDCQCNLKHFSICFSSIHIYCQPTVSVINCMKKTGSFIWWIIYPLLLVGVIDSAPNCTLVAATQSLSREDGNDVSWCKLQYMCMQAAVHMPR